MDTPLFDYDPRLPEALEDFAIEVFVHQLAIERFTEANFQWRS
jgi:hypothetical protein